MTPILLLLVPKALADPLTDARADAARFPQDYGAQVALARAATDPNEALAAWTAAAALVPGGNVETDVGLVEAALAAGDVSRARAVAAASVQRDPSSAVAWRLQALAKSTPIGLEATEWAEIASEPALAQARRIDPDSPLTWCARGYSRLRLGDLASARSAFSNAGDCGIDLGSRSAGAVGLWGAADLFPGGDTGVATTAWLGGHVLDRVGGELFLRDIEMLPTTGAAAGTSLQALGRVGYDTGELAVDVDGGVLGAISPVSSVTPVIGGRVRVTHGVGIGGSGVVTLYEDDTAWQGEAHVELPIVRAVHLTLGGQLDNAGPLGFAAVSLRTKPFDLDLAGRVGTEDRPVDLDSFTVWDLPRSFDGGASLDLRVALGRRFDVHAGYELRRMSATDLEPAAALHQVSLGLVFHSGGTP